jgi:uncharacterized protein (DUF1800 family)
LGALLGNVAEDRRTVAHLLRRTGFGPTASEVDVATARGYTSVVDDLLDFSSADPADATAPPAFTTYSPLGARNLTLAERQAINKQRNSELGALQRWWLARMTTTSHPLREKLTWFWHGHFATSYDKVRRPELMYRQNELFRSLGAGDFAALTQAVAKDPAMMIWLDTTTDDKLHPNENFARECMELFTLGIGNYNEADVRDAARAFTGWVVNPATGAWALRARYHDTGTKTVLGQTGQWGGEDVVNILVNSPISHAWVAARLWSHFAYPIAPSDPVVADLTPAYGAGRDVRALLRAILVHPLFTSTTARTGLVKQPVEWTLGALRALGLPAKDPRLVGALTALGQVPLRPPNVGGWPPNAYWLTTASSLARLQVATTAAAAADLSMVADAPPSQRVDATAHLLSVEWSDTTAKALATAGGSPKELVALALVAPEFVLA